MSDTKIISLISAPGGVGKTTAALCIGWFLKERNISSRIHKIIQEIEERSKS
jgi:cellulose biosynthesis protein BcsQ